MNWHQVFSRAVLTFIWHSVQYNDLNGYSVIYSTVMLVTWMSLNDGQKSRMFDWDFNKVPLEYKLHVWYYPSALKTWW
jgi:hypothetical protein